MLDKVQKISISDERDFVAGSCLCRAIVMSKALATGEEPESEEVRNRLSGDQVKLGRPYRLTAFNVKCLGTNREM